MGSLGLLGHVVIGSLGCGVVESSDFLNRLIHRKDAKGAKGLLS